jgi:hypothetical protein
MGCGASKKAAYEPSGEPEVKPASSEKTETALQPEGKAPEAQPTGEDKKEPPDPSPTDSGANPPSAGNAAPATEEVSVRKSVPRIRRLSTTERRPSLVGFNSAVDVVDLPTEVKASSAESDQTQDVQWSPTDEKNHHEEEILSPSKNSVKRLSNQSKDMDLMEKFVATVEDEESEDGSEFGSPKASKQNATE